MSGLLLSVPSSVWAQTGRPRGGTLSIVSSNEYPTLVPLYQNIGIAGTSGRVLEGLLETRSDLSVAPSLCKKWDVSEGGHVFTLNLQEGVRFHDGSPFTSSDVQFSLQLIRETNARRKVTFQYLEKIETPDPLTVILRFSRPVPFLLTTLTAKSCPMLPRRLWEGTDPRTNPYNAKPIGTGPYVFKEWERGSYHLLQRNPDYWRKDLPYLDQIIIKYIIDPGARLSAFESGTLGLGFQSPIAVEELDRVLKAHPDLTASTEGYEDNGAMNQLFFNLRTPVLQDVRVREAIAHSLDVQDYIQRVWKGYAVSAPSPIPPNQKAFFDTGIKHRAFDVAKAEQLLDQAGLPRGASGRRFSLRLTYNPYFKELKGGAEFIRSALDAIGVDVVLSNYDSATYVRTVYTNAAFDLDLGGVDGGFDPTDGVQRIYISSNRLIGLPFSNNSWYANDQVDELLDKASVETDPAIRRKYYLEFQKQVDRDLPVINLVSQRLFTLAKREIHDHTPDGFASSPSFATTYIQA
ncbi:ABC transporter substrate-binding protein [Pseudomonas sp. v388]|uniref:ABC transporter substrate-binding protein n=1 Tax=Pseudomonas sp. v388 TaxID=2479849 RepID=UPI001C49AFD9|nr:ABC transporter substrate-binding protein [Pseudomonas sp. v388]